MHLSVSFIDLHVNNFHLIYTAVYEKNLFNVYQNSYYLYTVFQKKNIHSYYWL